MTRTLILTRHAKSSWDDPDLLDHDRPLNNRGRKSAPAIGAWLKDNGWGPDELLCSTSVRTRETWDRMGLQTENAFFSRSLYHAEPKDMLTELSVATGESVLILGHNPGIAEFAEQMVKQAPDHPRFFDYPTCATTVMQFNIDSWTDIDWRMGDVLGFMIPRELLE